MTAVELLLALIRTTLATAAAACAAALLLAVLKVDSPRIHRAAWTLVVLQGWLLVPWTFKLEAPPETRDVPTLSTAAERGRESFATGEPVIVERFPSQKTPDPVRIAPLAVVAWLAGAALLTVAAAWRYQRIVRTLPLGAAPDNLQWQREWRREIKRAMPNRRGLAHFAQSAEQNVPDPLPRRFIRSPRIHFRLTERLGPLVAYIPFAYLLLAPRPLWIELTPVERAAILRHELAHIRRRDLWKSLALRLLALPQWFNPLVWLAVRRFDEAAEWACDDAAAARGLARDPTTVASALVRTAELTATQSSVRAALAFPAVPGAKERRRRSTLSRRIHRLVTPRSKEESTMRKLAVPALLAAIAAAQLIRIERVAAQSIDPAPVRPIVEEVTFLDDGVTVAAAEAAELRRNEFEAIARMPYVIEPPDVLLVKVESDDPRNSDETGPKVAPGAGLRITVPTMGPAPNALDFAWAVNPPTLLHPFGARKCLVEPDGRIDLGARYGLVFVAGLTVGEAQAAVASQLGKTLDYPRVAVHVHAYNSKVCYVIDERHGFGDVVRMPVPIPLAADFNVGKALRETGPRDFDLADAKIRIARPAANGVGSELILPVAWDGAIGAPTTETNHPILPGDRLFIEPIKPIENPQAPPIPVGATETADLAGYYSQEAAKEEPPTEAAPSQRLVFISLRMPDGKGVEWPVEYAAGTTIGEVLKNTTYPNPVDFDRAIITLSRRSRVRRDGRVTEILTTWPVGWDAAAGSNVAPDDASLKPGDRISIDLSPPPATPAIQPNPTPDNAAAPAPRVGELQVHDVVTVLIDYGAKAKVRHPQSFRIPCEITEIRANGNLCIEGQASIRNADEWWEMSLSGEVRRDAVGPDCTVKSDSIVNLDIHKRVVRPVFSFSLGFAGSGGLRSGTPTAAPAITPNPAPDAVPPAAAAPLAPPAAAPAAAPAASGPIEYKLAIIEDVSGDLGEFVDEGDQGAIRDTAALQPALRVLKKHGLVKAIADPRIVTQSGQPAEFNQAVPVPGRDRLFRNAQHVKIVGREASSLTATGPRRERPAINVEIEAHADHAGERCTLDAAFQLAPGQSAIARLKAPDGRDSPLYLVVTPDRVE